MTVLTIAIPTFNRLGYLKELLPELIRQCKPYPEIEILISDNCTTDGTFDYIHDLATSNDNVRFRANASNVGADENFIRCVEAARGKYVWLFGDDEQLCPGGIAKVMKTLATYPVSLLIMQVKYPTGSRWFRTYRDFINSVNPRIALDHTLITCNIFRKQVFDAAVARRYQLTSYGHMYSIIGSLKKKGTVYLLNDQVFTIRESRAPFTEKHRALVAKHIAYLSYLGISYPKMALYLCRFTAGQFLRVPKRAIGLIM